MFRALLTGFVFTALPLCVLAQQALAASTQDGPDTRDPFLARTLAEDPTKVDPNPFQKAYLEVALTRNYPEAFSQEELTIGPPQPFFTYRHNLDRHWMMGLGLGFRSFLRQPSQAASEPSRWLSLATFSHETYYVMRLTHPWYLMLGPKLLYMMPCEAAVVPITRDKNYVMEIGGALSAQLAWVQPDQSIVSLSFDRWRGFTTQRLQAVEIALGYSYAWR